MIFKGRYSQTSWDNPLAPFVEVSVRATDGKWVKVFFLIDLGADGTYLPHEYLKKLGIQLKAAEKANNVTGVGGQRAEHVPYTTQLRFSNSDEKMLDLEIEVFTQAESLDLPLLGRDVINFFTLLCDVQANLVWLIDEVDRARILQFFNGIDTP